MNDKFSSNNIENKEFKVNSNEIDYKNLIIRLEEIKTIIALLKKKIFK